LRRAATAPLASAPHRAEAALRALECRRAAGVLEATRSLFARENAMRPLHIRRTIALAAAVSATAVVAAGSAAADPPVDGPSQYGEWIADVGRPADQYRSRYQLKLGEARSFLAEVPATERGLDV
jgi:hypothetical protein